MSFKVTVACHLGDWELRRAFEAGDGLTVLVGPSGSGKTSLLNMIAGLLRPDLGRIAVGDQLLFDSESRLDTPPNERGLGYVFQDARLFPHMKVLPNLLYGHRLAPPQRRWMSCDEAVTFLGIAHLLDRWPDSLSGGEVRRVAIGRAMLAGARALLMDEPLTSLDGERRNEIMAVIERIRDELRLPILYVTHDSAEARRLATRVIAI